MLNIALRTLRTRWATFTGSFVALALGVCLLTVMGLALASSFDAPERRPERFATAEVVVQGQDTLRVSTPSGVRTEKLASPRPIPKRTIAALRKLGPVTEDRSFAVRAKGAPQDLLGHPWSTARFAPYELATGRAPRTADEVVATGTWTSVGHHLRTTSGTLRVIGTVRELPFENALFYTDAQAARLAPVSTQLVVGAAAAEVRRVVDGGGARPTQGEHADGSGTDTGPRVLTGDARLLADADPDRDSAALTTLNALFGTAGGVTGFVSVFVVASTFAFAVAQRRREFGLLRTVGATPGQIRRTVCAEALLIGALASAAGCALGGYAAPHLASRVVDGGLAPVWFRIGAATWPYHLAFWTGLLVALCGAATASWRAGRTPPTQALREASVDGAPLPRGRLLAGTALLLTAAATLALALLTDPGDLLHRKTYVSRPMLLITAVALLSPALIRPLVRLTTRFPGPIGMLVRENTATAARRTASLAAPILITVALTGSLLGTTAALNAARSAEARSRTTADFVLTSPVPFADTTVDRLRAIPDTVVSPIASSAVYTLEDDVALMKSEARAADPRALAATTRLPLTTGRVTALDDDSIIVNEEWHTHTVGSRVTVWLADGTRKSLRIAAVMPTGTGDNGVYVTPANVPRAPVRRIDVTVRGDTDPAQAAATLRRLAAGSGAELLTRQEWVRRTAPAGAWSPTDRATRLGFLLVLGIALLYTGISVANTQLMAAADRRRELTALRLAGATRAQLARLTTAEALTTVALGTILGLLVTALNLIPVWTALTLQSASPSLALPWQPLATTTTACALLATAAALPSTALALRRNARHPL
ncbi:FtsX-like permease family protein [Streptomyces sp. NPDC057257]|uniref:FtsX-like permease family protein n=1 Tax=Streptomyces sp. NPDC057257 TaxID=3346071 RepID=UPI00362A660A